MVIVCHFACDNATKSPKEKSGAEINTDTDSADSYSLNISGDSISYLHWTAENEILGLANIAFGDLDSMIARRYIRVLVPYSKTYYYVEGMNSNIVINADKGFIFFIRLMNGSGSAF